MRALIIGVLLVLASVAPLAAGPGTLRPFSTIEVMEIENKRNAQGKKLPDEWVPRVREQIRYAVGSQHLFHRVEDQVDAMVKGEDTGRTIRLQVRITDFSGAQAQPTIKAAVVFLDKATGEKILEHNVDAHLYFDQGATTSALNKLTNKVGDLVKNNW
jgi:hypothetical protein